MITQRHLKCKRIPGKTLSRRDECSSAAARLEQREWQYDVRPLLKPQRSRGKSADCGGTPPLQLSSTRR